jgi:catechol 2,3-dioxygenase-like lactoylglutathione lyase family enzyme
LEWKVPRPSRPTDPGGFARLRLAVDPDSALASPPALDAAGLVLEIVARDRPRVAGVVVDCSDLEASQAFYRDVLGLSRSADTTFCDGRGPEVFLIELTSVLVAPPPRVATNLGLYRLAMLTNDRDYDALTAAKVGLYSPPLTLDMGPGIPELRAVFFPDPDGTTFELIEQPTAGTAADPG